MVGRSLLAAAALVSACAGAPVAVDDAPPKTEWVVSAAPGMDALLMLGVASGDVMQAEFYGETVEFLRGRMSEDAAAALDRLDQKIRVENQDLTGPTLALLFSAGPIDSLDAVIASAEDPDTRLRPALEESPYWDEERYAEILTMMPDVRTALEGLKAVGFEAWYAEEMTPIIEAAVASNQAALETYDVIAEQQRLLGRELEPQIELLIVRFSMPYGIRILGQRFISHHGLEPEYQLRTAAHEIFHPPFDLDDEGLITRLADLEADPWMKSIVENHDPKFGYNSFEGIVNEDSAQALDQIVSERLGFAYDPAHRWAKFDGGMHLLAAAIYHAIKEDGFDEAGGDYSDWLKSALDRGLLSPQEVRRRAAEVAGEDAVQVWYDAMAEVR